jgi:UTP--glucose-1-phosphate uridylyltransferase
MGAAVEVFEGARALQVPRSRFAPVKSNNDLLVVRSDAYVLIEDFTLGVNPKRTIAGLPSVSLDSHFFGLLKDFESRMKAMPSLVAATSFTVKGNVEFDHPLSIEGAVTLNGPAEKIATVPKETRALRDQEISLS